MNNIFKILLIGLVGVFILTGCRTGATVYNVPTSDISVKKGTTDDQVFKAIRTAGAQLGWIITKVKPNIINISFCLVVSFTSGLIKSSFA